MGKKIKEDKKPPPEDVFDTLLVESHQAATVVLMLSSPEVDVQSKACAAIYKFVEKCDGNKKVLLELKCLDPLLRLMRGEDRAVRRDACMALSTLCYHPEVRKAVRKREDAIPALINLLQPDEESVVLEYSALGLCYLAQEYASKVAIFENRGVEPLIRCLSSADPDVQKNSIEAISHMLLDYQTRGSIKDYNGFQPILNLLRSEFCVVQKLALLVLDRLTHDVDNRAAFRELATISSLLDVLARPDLSDLHVMVVMVISNILEDYESLEQIKETGGLRKLVALITDQPLPKPTKGEKKPTEGRAGKKMSKAEAKKAAQKLEDHPMFDTVIPTLPDVKVSAAKAIARSARSGENRKILHELEAEKMLIHLLSHENQEVQSAAAQAIAIMCETRLCRDSIREWDGLPPLVKLLSSDNADVKESVTLALANLTLINTTNSKEMVNLSAIDSLISMLSDERDEVIANAACVLTNIAYVESIRVECQKKGIISSLIGPIGSSNTNVQAKAALAISAFVCDSQTRTELRDFEGIEPLVLLLSSGSVIVQKNAAWAINVCGSDLQTAAEICRHGGLDILQKIQMSTIRRNPFAENALEKLLDTNLSAKYALLGHLGSCNLIEDGFFDAGQLKPSTKFLTIEDYSTQDLNDRRPIILINARPLDKEEKQREEDIQTLIRLGKQPVEPVQKDPFVTPGDNMLCKYLEEVMEKIEPLSTTREQIIALAMFVSEKMGGPIERGQVANYSWQLPLSQIKFELQSNVVPIGKVKFAIHLHRALLFKTLADRIAVSCTLTRGNYNRVWNEVMLLDEDEENQAPKFPPKTYIVDLIHEPGALLLINTPDAMNYTKF